MTTKMRPLHAHDVRQSHRENGEEPRRDVASGSTGTDRRPCPAASKAIAEDLEEPSHADVSSVQRMAKVLTAARAQSARIVGITGTSSGVGVSTVSRELAEAFAGAGQKTLLLDLSRTVLVDASENADTILKMPAPERASETSPLLFTVISDGRHHGPMTVAQWRSTLQHYVHSGYVVVVDLPPVLLGSGAISPAFPALAELCEHVSLVCLSGKIVEKELSACIQACAIVGLKPAGLILNDWRMPASNLIDG